MRTWLAAPLTLGLAIGLMMSATAAAESTSAASGPVRDVPANTLAKVMPGDASGPQPDSVTAAEPAAIADPIVPPVKRVMPSVPGQRGSKSGKTKLACAKGQMPDAARGKCVPAASRAAGN